MKTVVVTPDDSSPTKPEMPSWQLWASSRRDGALRTKATVLLFFKKWVLQMAMLSIGEMAVASAAPGSPSPMGKMKM